ncbi:DUF484 family protein [Hydrogenophaga sp.]|uniref:DUF484 family protein n=1 Tax=Hydrogenophaga sp. TaxID=1904254 RepID=UPI00198B9095|nr:DUF484 family protein [Hydrogenophaga sp.]MBD3894129.1 DUF484 family protein [Hydrogenophaga sp.]
MKNEPIAPITEDDIANYLANTPDFFERHAGLLAAVQLSNPHGLRAVSLQERQAVLLRDKIKGLEIKAVEMIRHGHENSALADKLHAWTCALLRSADAKALPALLARELTAQFGLPQVALKVWAVRPEFAAEPFAQGVSDDLMTFAASLMRPYCGANPGLEAAQWLAEPQAAASLALIPLRAAPAAQNPQAFGLLVLASPDARRFAADMGTDLLERIGELASAALLRLCPA